MAKAKANANANAPLRRSNRIAKQLSARTFGPSTATGNGNGSGSPPKVLRPLKSKNELDGLMIKIYAEIHDAAINPVASADRDDIHSLLRKARTVRFLKLLPKKKRDDVLKALDKFKSSSTRRVGRVYQDAMDIIKVSPPTVKDRLQSFPTLLLVSICSHSSSFRAALADSNLKNPTWKNIVDRIKVPAVASSLELFARTRGLEWRRALAASDADLGVFLKSVLRDFDFKPDGITASNMGINANGVDVKEVHPNANDSSPYHWVLPLDNKKEAVRCAIEYTVTSDLVRDGFATANSQVSSSTAATASASASINVGDLQSAHQLNIAQTILLPNYDWKNLSAEADGDPRFCGYKDNHCEVCGSEYSLVSSSECDCTFSDLCSRSGYADSVLVELMTTERTGTGVRALQDIRDKQFLGEYIGEIYPVKRQANNGQAVARYGGSAGHSYMLEVEIVKASDTASDGGNSPANKRRTRGAKGAKAGNRVSKATAAASPSSVGGKKTGGTKATCSRPAFVIDSAVRGNWIRYINHSCRPNTRFETVNLGHRRVVLVKAMRRIDYGDELTIDYGDAYFTAFDYGCKCGHGSCRYWREGVGATPDHVTLKMAVDQKIAPQWAMNDKNVPIVDGKTAKGSGKGNGNTNTAAAKGRTTRSTTAAAKAAKATQSGIP